MRRLQPLLTTATRVWIQRSFHMLARLQDQDQPFWEKEHSHCTQTTFSLGLPLSFWFIAANKQSYTSLIPKLVWITVWLLHYMTVMEWGYFGDTVVIKRENKEKQTINPFRKYQRKNTENMFCHKSMPYIKLESGAILFNLSVYVVTSSHMLVNSLVRQLVVTLGVSPAPKGPTLAENE